MTILKQNFESLAVFADSVATDGDGKASVSYTLPDNLTSYRVWAFAATQACFGFIEEAVTAQLPLMVCVTACGRLRDFERLCGLLLCLFDLFGCTLSISFTSNLAFESPSDPSSLSIQVRPSPPRFLNFGDECEVNLVLQNQTEGDLTVYVGFRCANAALMGDHTGGYKARSPSVKPFARFGALAAVVIVARRVAALGRGKLTSISFQQHLPLPPPSCPTHRWLCRRLRVGRWPSR